MKRVQLPSPAMIVAMVALFVALGGTSYALTKGEKKKVRSIATEVSTTVSKTTSNQKVFGATSSDAGAIVAATLPGTTVSRTGNNYKYTFPRSVAGCAPVASGSANGTVAATIAPEPNSVDVGPNGGGANSVIVVCP